MSDFSTRYAALVERICDTELEITLLDRAGAGLAVPDGDDRIALRSSVIALSVAGGPNPDVFGVRRTVRMHIDSSLLEWERRMLRRSDAQPGRESGPFA